MKATAYVVRVRGRAKSWRDWFHIDASKPQAESKAEAEFEKVCSQSPVTDVTFVKVSEDVLGHRRGTGADS